MKLITFFKRLLYIIHTFFKRLFIYLVTFYKRLSKIYLLGSFDFIISSKYSITIFKSLIFSLSKSSCCFSSNFCVCSIFLTFAGTGSRSNSHKQPKSVAFSWIPIKKQGDFWLPHCYSN